MHSFFRRGHQAIEQRNVQSMQVLQSVKHPELRPQVEMQRRVADGSEIHQNDITVSLLQRYRSVNSSRGASRTAFGAEKSENLGFARPARSSANRAVARERIQQ